VAFDDALLVMALDDTVPDDDLLVMVLNDALLAMLLDVHPMGLVLKAFDDALLVMALDDQFDDALLLMALDDATLGLLGDISSNGDRFVFFVGVDCVLFLNTVAFFFWVLAEEEEEEEERCFFGVGVSGRDDKSMIS
jgi:hypothetical protein